jgi:hypothetical protein
MIFWIYGRGRTMATERANDLRAFKGSIEETLSNGGSDFTLDEALVHRDIENQTDEERQATLRAIDDGLANVDAGRTRPFVEFDNLALIVVEPSDLETEI